jgi:hypothetical protein
VADEDIRHAVAQALRSYPSGERLLLIGPSRDGRLLEIVVIDADTEPVAIHAMVLRPRFFDLLR